MWIFVKVSNFNACTTELSAKLAFDCHQAKDQAQQQNSGCWFSFATFVDGGSDDRKGI